MRTCRRGRSNINQWEKEASFVKGEEQEASSTKRSDFAEISTEDKSFELSKVNSQKEKSESNVIGRLTSFFPSQEGLSFFFWLGGAQMLQQIFVTCLVGFLILPVHSFDAALDSEDSLLVINPAAFQVNGVMLRSSLFSGKSAVTLSPQTWIRTVTIDSVNYGICYSLSVVNRDQRNVCTLNDGLYTWVLLATGDLLVTGTYKNGFEWGTKHIALAQGEPVYAAGEFKISDGIEWNLNSGSFMSQISQANLGQTLSKPELDAYLSEVYQPILAQFWNQTTACGQFFHYRGALTKFFSELITEENFNELCRDIPNYFCTDEGNNRLQPIFYYTPQCLYGKSVCEYGLSAGSAFKISFYWFSLSIWVILFI